MIQSAANKRHFQETMCTLGWLGVSEQELAGLVSTTPNAVNRWLNGRSSPSVIIRALVIRAALDIVRRDGFKIAGEYFDPVTGRPISVAR